MKSKILLITLMLFYININSQTYIDFINESKTKNFKEIVNKVEEHYLTKDKGRGSGYKQFKRWEHYNSTRLSEDGKIVDLVTTNFNEFYFYQKKYSNINNSNLAQKPLNGDNSVSGNWKSVGPTSYSRIVSGHNGGLGRVTTVEFDTSSNERYIGTPGGGLWRHTPNGYEALTDGIPRLGVSGIALDQSSPSNNKTIYILTGDGDAGHTPGIGVLKSTDHGNTWYSTGLTGSDIGSRGYKLKMHPNDSNTLFAIGSNGIFKTTNGGLSWVDTTTSLSGTVYDIEFNPNNPSIMYASTRDEIYRSTNSGNSWSVTSFVAPTGVRRIELAVTPNNSNYVYAVCGGNWTETSSPEFGFNGVYRSVDSGASFSRRSNSPNILGYSTTGNDNGDQSWYDLAIAVSPINANDVHIGGVNTWRSIDGGVTWDNTSNWLETSAGSGNYTHADIHDLKYFNTRLYCASDGGLFSGSFTDNSHTTSTWTNLSEVGENGLQISQIYRLGLGTDSGSTRSSIYFGSQDNGLNAIKSNSSEALHWEGGDGFETCVLPNNNFVVGETQFGNLNRMSNETSFVNITPSDQSGAWLTPLVSYNEGGTIPNNILYVGYQDVFHQSTSNGTGPSSSGWTNISNGQIGADNSVHIAIAPSDNNYIYVSKDTELYRTTNHGKSWTDINSNLPSIREKSYFVVHPTNPNIVYTVISGLSSGNKVYRTTNGGTNWTNISGSLPNVNTNCILHDESSSNGLYVGMDVGVFYIDDDLDDWVPFYNDLPNVGVTELEINHTTNDIYASTWGRGIWKSSLYGKFCQSSAVLSDNLEGFKSITANNISSSSTVEPFANVIFTASNSIVLTNGFAANSNNNDFSFNAKIDSDVCSQGVSAKSTQSKTGIYAGPLPGVIGLLQNDSENNISHNSNYLYTFPNPSDSHIYMQFQLKNPNKVSFNLFDMKGNSILNEIKLIEYSGTVVEKLNSSKIQPGIYILEVVSDGNRQTKKVIIQH